MQFVEVTKQNFLQAIELRAKRTQYRFTRRDVMLYSMGRAYIADRTDEAIPLIIEHEGKFVGGIRLRNYGHGVGFDAFFIDRKHQGKGLARMAMVYLVDYVKEHFPEAEEIETAVLPDNAPARKLYESIGLDYTGVVNEDGTMDMEMQI